MLHVDAKGDTYINGTDTLDDVVITQQGRIGVGTLNPQARLHIVSPTAGAIRIADGSEGVGKMLVSDVNGSARWKPASWYAELYGGSSHGAATGSGATGWPPFTYTGYELFPAGTGSVDLAAGTIKVPYTALYKITLSGTAHTTRNYVIFYALVYVKIGTTNIEAVHPQMLKSLAAPLDFGCFFFWPLTAGDEVSLYLRALAYNIDANQFDNVNLVVESIN